MLPDTEPEPAAVPHAESHLLPQTHNPDVIVAVIVFLCFIIGVGSYLGVVPTTRIYEDIICHRFYEKIEGDGYIGLNQNIDEGLCKGDEIQKELAIVVAGLESANAVPSVLLAFPYGLLADRIGRKKVFGLSILGIVLSSTWVTIVCWFWQAFPLRLIWVAPIFRLIGGGDTVATAAIFAIVADVTTEASRLVMI